MKRIGIIYPGESTGGTELANIQRWLRDRGLASVAADVVYSASDGRHDLASLESTGALAVLIDAAMSLEGRGCSAVVWACTSGSFIAGLAGARRQISALSEVLKVPATSASIALARAACSLRQNSVEVLSPYPAPIGDRFVAFLAEFGISAVAISHLDAESGGESRKLDLYEQVNDHERRHGRSGFPLLVPDTAIDTLALVADLESTFDRVIVTANQASVWDALRLAGCGAALQDAGALFQSRPAESRSC